MPQSSGQVSILRHRPGGAFTPAQDAVAIEEPLEIRIAGRPIAVTMRTPGHDDELAAGFLLSEGVVRERREIAHVRGCNHASGAVADVVLAGEAGVDFAKLTRHVFASSSCGVCGAGTIDAVRKQFPPVGDGATVSAGVLYELPRLLRAQQRTFDQTGGLHGAAVFDRHGALVVAREDVGRHNAVDKVLGNRLLAGVLPLADHTLLVSGRASFEIVQKALAAGIPIVAAVSAPSSLAVDLAEEANITLVGFLREGGFNVYSHPTRISP